MEEKDLKIEEIKKIELQILEEIDNICTENELNYSLMGGSALGAVRHKGFIPWDDDIDIMMLREDYDKLEKIMSEKTDNDIKLLSCEKQENFPYPYIKVVSLNTEAKEIGIKKIKDYGVFIDIFPVDKVPDDKNELDKLIKKMKILKKIYLIKLYEKQISKTKSKLLMKKMVSILIKPIHLQKIVKKMDDLSKKYNNAKGKYYGNIYAESSLNKKIFYPKEFFSNTHRVKFENKEILLIDDYDKYLKDSYNDYMKLPDEKNRVSGHNWEYIRLKNNK